MTPAAAELRDIEAQLKLPVTTIEEMWENSVPLGELITISGVSRTRLYKLAKLLGWQRGANYEKTGKAAKDPSEEEIASRAAEIRATWSPGEEEKRFRGKKRQAAYTHSLTYDVRAGAFVPCTADR